MASLKVERLRSALPQGPRRVELVRVVGAKALSQLERFSAVSRKVSSTQVTCKAIGSPASGPKRTAGDVVADFAYQAIVVAMSVYLVAIILMKAWHFLVTNWSKLLAVEAVSDSQVVLLTFGLIIVTALRHRRSFGHFLQLPEKGVMVDRLATETHNLGTRLQNLESRVDGLATAMRNLGTQLHNLESRVHRLATETHNLGTKVDGLMTGLQGVSLNPTKPAEEVGADGVVDYFASPLAPALQPSTAEGGGNASASAAASVAAPGVEAAAAACNMTPGMQGSLPRTALGLLGFACSRGWAAVSTHIVLGLMDMGLSMTAINAAVQAAHGWSALHLAAASGSPELMGMMALWRSYGAGAAAGAAGAGAAGAGTAAGEIVGGDEGELRGTAAAAAGGGSAQRRGGGVAEEWRAMVAALNGPVPWHACGSWV